MLRALIVLLASLLSSCGLLASEDVALEQSAEDAVANEAHIELTDAELAHLTQRGDQGDREAIEQLVNYYWINRGDRNEDTIYWQLQAARVGDCDQWSDLIFMTVDETHPVPPHLFSNGETLTSIGEANGCPHYSPRKPG
jgi:hypothetical protein